MKKPDNPTHMPNTQNDLRPEMVTSMRTPDPLAYEPGRSCPYTESQGGACACPWAASTSCCPAPFCRSFPTLAAAMHNFVGFLVVSEFRFLEILRPKLHAFIPSAALTAKCRRAPFLSVTLLALTSVTADTRLSFATQIISPPG